MRKNGRYIWIIFSAFLLVNIVISFFQQVPTTHPDELCYISQARHFAENFEYLRCRELLGKNITEGAPLHSILLSPFYLLFRSQLAYRIILLVNAILLSLLIFPLTGILRHYLKNEKKVIFGLLLTLAIPQFSAYAHTLMSETYFLATNILFLYFYLKSFGSKDTKKFKFLSLLLAITAIFLRPFGFITIFSFLISEFILSKNKKKILVPLLFIFILSTIPIFTLKPQLFTKVFSAIFLVFTDFDSFKYLLYSIRDQINSFNIATITVLSVYFYTVLIQTDDEKIKTIRPYLLSFTFLNFLIGVHHIFGYYLGNLPGNLITRYINVSLVLIIVFSFIFLFKGLKPKNKPSYFLTILVFFLPLAAYKLIWRGVSTPTFDLFKIVILDNFYLHLLVPTSIILLALLCLKRIKTIMVISAIVLLTFSGYQKFGTTLVSRQYHSDDTLYAFFKDREDKILIIDDKEYMYLSYESAILESISEADINRYKLFNNQINDFDSSDNIASFFYQKSLNQVKNMDYQTLNALFKEDNYDYVVSNLNLNLDKVRKTPKTGNIYKINYDNTDY